MRDNYKRRNCISEDNFMSSINECADGSCAVCRKLLYPRQLETSFRADLSSDLVELSNVVICSHWSSNMQKRKVPSQAF